MPVSLGRRAGRTHRERRVACQDAYAARETPDGRIVAAVADGLGSCRLSEHGSQAAVDAAVASLAACRSWTPRALHRAFRVARSALARRAQELGAPIHELATTLHLVGLAPQGIVAASIGDGAILAADPTPRILLPPEDSEYANHVVPITHEDWEDHLRIAVASHPGTTFLLTDGLTRLLLVRRKGHWTPYAPFFDAVLPPLQDGGLDPNLVPRLLAKDRLDQAWDDDKCLVVMRLAGATR